MNDDTGLEKEYKRWKDYANVLLIALTVLFAGPSIGTKNWYAIPAVIFGVAGIVFVVIWYAKEKSFQLNGRPGALFIASMCLGAQAVFVAARYSLE